MMPTLLSITNKFSALWERLETFEQVLLVASIVLLVISKQIVNLLSHQNVSYGYRSGFRVTAFRAINLLVIATIILKGFFWGGSEFTWYQKILGTVLIAYTALLGSQSTHFLLLKRFGKAHTVSEKTVMSETYTSRMLGIVSILLIIIIAIISIIHILGFTTLLEATGVIGFFGVMLALTQASWAPDIISGLIILNSGLVEDGDVIELNNGKTLGTIYKTRLFYTEVLDLTNNHRIMISNSQLRNMSLHNLSKFASAKGLRECMKFKIGYDVSEKKIRKCFTQAFEKTEQDKRIYIETQHPLDIEILEAGDDAIEWGVYYYTKNTRKIIPTRNGFRKLIIHEAQQSGIKFATPRLYQIEQTSPMPRYVNDSSNQD